MKLYVWGTAPNPRRVKIYLAEKGLTVPMEEVGGEGAALKPEYKAKYPSALVPMLELDDGTQIGEAMAICRYFEAMHPTPPLMGTDAKDQALVEMWERRAYDEGMVGAAEVFRNSHPLFAGRSIPGYAEEVAQQAQLVTRGKQRLAKFFSVFDAQLAHHEFVAGARYSVADITTLCSVDFARHLAKVPIPEACAHLQRWYAAMNARPSAKV